jgi:hypothetical protein
MEIFDGAKLVVTVWYESENPNEEITLTFAEAVPVLPAESLALNVTFVPPIGNADGASLVTLTLPSVASFAVAP